MYGTKRQHKGNSSGNIGAAEAAMAMKVEGDRNDSLNKNSGEITAKRDSISEPFF